jgi:hypothetical protein
MDSGQVRNMQSTLSNKSDKYEAVHLVGFHYKNITLGVLEVIGFWDVANSQFVY